MVKVVTIVMVALPSLLPNDSYPNYYYYYYYHHSYYYCHQQVFRDPNAREMLKPRNMAGCSPRIFWSLVHLMGKGDICGHLKKLLPLEDWSFLKERHRELSEKALENQRQKEEEKREKEKRKRLRELEKEARLERRRKKEEEKRKKQAGNAEKEVVLVEDGEEGQEEEKVDEEYDYPEVVSDEWVEVVRAPPLKLKKAKDMAGEDEEELVKKLESVIKEKRLPLSPPSSEQVAEWINECQAQVMEDFMRELVGDKDFIDDLERASMGTPKDIILWSGTPRMMINVIREEAGEERWEEIKDMLDEDVVVQWGAKCREAMEAMPWLEDWATDVL